MSMLWTHDYVMSHVCAHIYSQKVLKIKTEKLTKKRKKKHQPLDKAQSGAIESKICCQNFMLAIFEVFHFLNAYYNAFECTLECRDFFLR